MSQRVRSTARKPSQRRAAPDALSGRNPNVPVNLYDTHPNAIFAIGEEVVSIDPDESAFRGLVLGHAAEDRIWIQLGTTIEQVDAADWMPIRLYRNRGMVENETLASPLVASRRATLDFSAIPEDDLFGETEDDLEFLPDGSDDREAFDVLPAEQDPQDSIDDGSGGEDDLVTVIDLESLCGGGGESHDKTDLIESTLGITSSANRVARRSAASNAFRQF